MEAATSTSQLTVAERRERGRAARKEVPRSSHGDWKAPSDRADPIGLLEEQARTRVPELVPIRHGRMAASPFAFFRGAAYVMASDLASTPRTGMQVQACGDAHLSNFGGFAAPDRQSVFDVNDFDETLPGPWEWDVKRLAASMEIAGRDRGFEDKDCDRIVRSAVNAYRVGMREFADMGNLDVFYLRMDRDLAVARAKQYAGRDAVAQLEANVERSKRKDSQRALRKLTVEVDGEHRFQAAPPLLVPVRQLVPDVEADEIMDFVGGVIAQYRASLRPELRRLLERYRFVDLARKVVGVGSVGTRAWVVLLLGRNGRDPLLLQVKEAEASVLERFVGNSEYDNHGQRVVEGQRATQAASDVLLGWIRAEGLDGVHRDFYVRQLWDWKQSADLETMDVTAFDFYGGLCGWTLARAHARSGDPVQIAAYLGSADNFDRAIHGFAHAYADQNQADHDAFVAAIDAGRIEAQRGI
jgi:uncharacterized protein (DUF2252 family)